MENSNQDNISQRQQNSFASNSLLQSQPNQQQNDQYAIKRSIASAKNPYQFSFPSSLERFFQPFDDYLISICQYHLGTFMYIFSYVLTCTTAIEVSLPFAAIFYSIGYDSAAGLITSCILTLALVSQLPKKFIHRSRPWVVSRALPIRTDTTSSFPSRAVVCAVVFGWLFHHTIHMNQFQRHVSSIDIQMYNKNPIMVWITIIMLSLLSAFARINVGAHYPSDTIFGFFLGCFIVKLGVWFESFWQSACSSTIDAIQTSQKYIPITSWWQVVTLTSYRRFVPATIICYLFAVISMQGFWVKCGYVYGMLLSVLVFRYTYICPSMKSELQGIGVLSNVTKPWSRGSWLFIGAYFTILTAFGMVTKGKQGKFQVFTFSIIYFCCLIGMIMFRIGS